MVFSLCEWCYLGYRVAVSHPSRSWEFGMVWWRVISILNLDRTVFPLKYIVDIPEFASLFPNFPVNFFSSCSVVLPTLAGKNRVLLRLIWLPPDRPCEYFAGMSHQIWVVGIAAFCSVGSIAQSIVLQLSLHTENGHRFWSALDVGFL